METQPPIDVCTIHLEDELRAWAIVISIKTYG